MRTGKGGLSLDVHSQEGNLDAEHSGTCEAELRGLQMTDLDKRTDIAWLKCWFVDEESAWRLLFQMKEFGPIGRKYKEADFLCGLFGRTSSDCRAGGLTN